jgi:Protein of unknown function (DUF3048) N-terminal domain/Protein of unknown function (DUF3048) C-terminal domain
MFYPRYSFTIYLLLFALLTSCVSTPGQPSLPVPASGSTSTPFQPGLADAPLNDSYTPQPVVTFTPYPTVPASHNSFLVPEINTPPGGAADGSSAIDPLTGLAPIDPGLLQARPIAIKVSNYPRYVRPQSGLTHADIVFEYYIEFLLTRFIAVYYGNTANMVGPVRSGRYFDEHVIRMYHAFYVFQYADPRELNYFKSGDLNSFLVLQGFGTCPPFFNSRRGIEIYNDAYFDITKWKDCAAQHKLDNSPQQIRSGFFSVGLPEGGITVDRIYTHYSVDDYNYWEYDPATQRYVRYQELTDARDNKPESYAPLMDYLNNQQVAADNVVELFVSHTFANQFDQQDQVYHINLVDSGNAFVFRNGVAFPARWFRSNIDQPLVLSTPAGMPIYMKPGQTFFQVIGETSRDWSDGTDWHFDFQTP